MCVCVCVCARARAGGGGVEREALYLLWGRLIEVYQEMAVRLSHAGKLTGERNEGWRVGSCVAVQDMKADWQTADG